MTNSIHDLEGQALALEALNAFSSPRMGDLDERITDLITNLLLLAERQGIKAETIIKRVGNHMDQGTWLLLNDLEKWKE